MESTPLKGAILQPFDTCARSLQSQADRESLQPARLPVLLCEYSKPLPCFRSLPPPAHQPTARVWKRHRKVAVFVCSISPNSLTHASDNQCETQVMVPYHHPTWSP